MEQERGVGLAGAARDAGRRGAARDGEVDEGQRGRRRRSRHDNPGEAGVRRGAIGGADCGRRWDCGADRVGRVGAGGDLDEAGRAGAAGRALGGALCRAGDGGVVTGCAWRAGDVIRRESRRGANRHSARGRDE